MTLELTSQVVAGGLHFGEGPRVRGSELWCSDMHGRRVVKFSSSWDMTTVLQLEDDEPSGLGWLPDGTLLIVTMQKRCVLRYDGQQLTQHADLSALASWHTNDMVVGPSGNAYVGNFGFDLHNQEAPREAELVMVRADGSAEVVAHNLRFPNGTVITPDEQTLIVAESFGGTLTAFDIAADGSLNNRRTWADLPEGAVPDGICLDASGGIWAASPTSNESIRLEEGGRVTHRVAFDRGAYACILQDDVLLTLTCSDSHPDRCRTSTTGQVVAARAPYAAAGWP